MLSRESLTDNSPGGWKQGQEELLALHMLCACFACACDVAPSTRPGGCRPLAQRGGQVGPAVHSRHSGGGVCLRRHGGLSEVASASGPSRPFNH